jgi:SAM-dependent methyltransferase
VASREERSRSFGAIADDYDRLRPSPPAVAVDWLVPENCAVALDVAAGTGLLSRKLTGRFRRVIAVEPDARMAAVLRARSPGVRVVQGTAEAIPAADACADGVFVSSAWHWMDPDRAIPEIARVLRDGGRFGVIWTSRDHQVEWLRNLNRHRELSQTRDDDRDRDREPPATSPDARPDSQGDGQGGARPRSWRRAATLPADGEFGNIETESFAFSRTMTAGDFVAMLATYSGVITASREDRAAALTTAQAMLDERFPGASEIDVPMRAWCWRADRTPRAAR